MNESESLLMVERRDSSAAPLFLHNAAADGASLLSLRRALPLDLTSAAVLARECLGGLLELSEAALRERGVA